MWSGEEADSGNGNSEPDSGFTVSIDGVTYRVTGSWTLRPVEQD
jgi:hypothetical protein